MLAWLKAKNPTLGFYYCLIPTLILVVIELIYIYILLTPRDAGGDTGIGIFIIIGLPLLLAAIGLEYAQLYTILMKFRAAFVTAIIVTTIEWIAVLSVLYNYIQGYGAVFEQIYTDAALTAPIVLALIIYIREMIMLSRKQRELTDQPAITPPPKQTSPS